MTCPGTNPGCRCPACETFASYMRRLTGKSYGLPESRPEPVLRVVEVTEACDVCDHPSCQRQRLRERQKYQQAKRMPWEQAA